MDVGFDIETMRNGALIDRLPEPEISLGNLKDPAKIEEKKSGCESGADRKDGTFPDLGAYVQLCNRRGRGGTFRSNRRGF